jgi:hypothetical protein
MDLQPFATDDCTMCGSMGARFKYCEGTCLHTSGGDGLFDNVRPLSGPATPHFHRTCFQCGFVWLTVVKERRA